MRAGRGFGELGKGSERCLRATSIVHSSTEERQNRRRRRAEEGRRSGRENASIPVACVWCVLVICIIDMRLGIACSPGGAPVRMFVGFARYDDPLSFLMRAGSVGDGWL